MKITLYQHINNSFRFIGKQLSTLFQLFNNQWQALVLKAHPALVWTIRLAMLMLAMFLLMKIVPGVTQKALVSASKPRFWHFSTDTLLVQTETDRLNKEIEVTGKKLGSYIPKNHYLIINSTENTFFLYKGTELVREGKCSTGSYLQLEKGEKQKWLFKTPKGEFKIRNKRTDPVWKKPDWAFVEEGLPVPSANHPSRFEYGVLGDYALSLGDGYLIHGTLYQRYLGLPVTHGCVRLSDPDLEAVYKALPMGAKVYIF
jgi:L,D-transpeptidase ErfK/SrfK